MNQLQRRLQRPFPVREVKFRKGKGDTMLAYADARAFQRRLDEVFGLNWKTEYRQEGDRLFCRVSFYHEDYACSDTWTYREDCGSDSNFEAEKGGASDAFKRACVQLGIGRYLYALPPSAQSHQTLPAWATPEGFDEALDAREAAEQGEEGEANG